MMDQSAMTVCDRLGEMIGDRVRHEDTWRECYDYSFPTRGSGFNGEIIDASTAAAKKAELLDGVSTDAGNTLASSLQGGLTPANAMWADLYIGEDDTDEEARWLGDAARRMWMLIHASNFDAEALEAQLDMVAAGWFVMFIDEGPEGGYQFETWPLSECYVASSTVGGPIDIVYRRYCPTAQQVVKEYGPKASETLQDLAAKKPLTRVELVRAIYPRKVYDPTAVMGKNMKFASVTVEKGTKHVLRESGFPEQPFVAPRWARLPGSPYATGPMLDALPDCRELNDLTFLEKSAVEMALAPPLVAEDDGVLNPRLVKIGPRKIIVANSVDSIKPLYDGANVNIGWTAKQDLQRAIRRTLMADMLEPQDGPTKTATEVHARMQLIRQVLGPRYGRMQSEYLNPLVRRCFGLAYRAGVFGPAPESLVDRIINVRYLSPLARAQQMEEVAAVERLFATAGQMAAAMPDILDNLDGDEAIRINGKALGAPSKVIRSARDVAKLRKGRADAQAAMQQQAALQPTMDEAGKALVQQAIGA